jgi:N-methylhydantoinase B
MAVNVMGDVPNLPVEVVEMRYPMRIDQFALRPETAGRGRHRGGAGVRRDYRMLEGGILLQWSTENTKQTIAQGAHGGQDGAPSQVVVNPDAPNEVVLEQRVTAYGPLQAGDVVSVRSGGGGGWGDPAERDDDALEADALNGWPSG